MRGQRLLIGLSPRLSSQHIVEPDAFGAVVECREYRCHMWPQAGISIRGAVLCRSTHRSQYQLPVLTRDSHGEVKSVDVRAAR